MFILHIQYYNIGEYYCLMPWQNILRHTMERGASTKKNVAVNPQKSTQGCDWHVTRWCPSSLAKLVNITPISLWFVADITIVFMGFINQLITGGHHPVQHVTTMCLVWYPKRDQSSHYSRLDRWAQIHNDSPLLDLRFMSTPDQPESQGFHSNIDSDHFWWPFSRGENIRFGVDNRQAKLGDLCPLCWEELSSATSWVLELLGAWIRYFGETSRHERGYP